SNLRGEPLDYFKPEFVNRIDEIVRFGSLDRSDLAKIVDIQLRQLDARLSERGLVLQVSADAKGLLSERGYDPDFGARPLRRVIQRELGDALALALLNGQFPEGSVVHVDVIDNRFVLN
ncbi:MAG: type VI secretion system ATPase TssH, partial [Gaiellaceae bacterium]